MVYQDEFAEARAACTELGIAALASLGNDIILIYLLKSIN